MTPLASAGGVGWCLFLTILSLRKFTGNEPRPQEKIVELHWSCWEQFPKYLRAHCSSAQQIIQKDKCHDKLQLSNNEGKTPTVCQLKALWCDLVFKPIIAIKCTLPTCMKTSKFECMTFKMLDEYTGRSTVYCNFVFCCACCTGHIMTYYYHSRKHDCFIPLRGSPTSVHADLSSLLLVPATSS